MLRRAVLGTLCVGLLLQAHLPAAAVVLPEPRYVVTDVGELPEFLQVGVSDVNESRQVSGTAAIRGGGSRGFVWEDGSYRLVDPPPSAPADFTSSSVATIDEQARTAGTLSTTRGGRSGQETYLADGEIVTYLSGLLEVAKMNDQGAVVGYAAGGDNCAKAALWQNGTTTVLTGDGRPCTISTARDVNAAGDVVGFEGSAAMLWSADGSKQPLGHLFEGECQQSDAKAVNDSRQIVGFSTTASGCNEPHAFLWEDGRLRDLGMAAGTLGSRAYDINGAGTVVGESLVFGGGIATLWEDGVAHDLNDLIQDEEWFLGTAIALNNAGDIVGGGVRNGEFRAFLLTDPASPRPTPGPVPPVEPLPDLLTERVWLRCNNAGPTAPVTSLQDERPVGWSAAPPTSLTGCGSAVGGPGAVSLRATGSFEGRLQAVAVQMWLVGPPEGGLEVAVTVDDGEVYRENVPVDGIRTTGTAPVEIFVPVDREGRHDAGRHEVELFVRASNGGDVTLLQYDSTRAPSGLTFNP